MVSPVNFVLDVGNEKTLSSMLETPPGRLGAEVGAAVGNAAAKAET